MGFLEESNSETCYQGEEPNKVRFVCPRQNEPREFLYCCKINGNDTNLTCCADKALSKYYHDETQIEMDSDSYSFSEAFWYYSLAHPTMMLGQIIIGIYIIFVIGLMAVDFVSHLKLRKRHEDAETLKKTESSQS